MTPETRDALVRYLLTVADDELVLGYRDSEWTAAAPMVEEDVAFSSLAQDEIGHARLYYLLAAELTGGDADRLALLRPKSEYSHARLLEERTAPKYMVSGEHLPGGGWSRAVARRYLYDLFDDLRTSALAESAYPPLAGAVRKVRREEHYHLRHGDTWWRALAEGGADAHERLQRTLDTLWPGLLGLFEEAPGELQLQAEGLLSRRTSELRPDWLDRVADSCAKAGLRLPDGPDAALLGGREGRHGPDWDDLYDDMTMVRRIEPEGVW